MTVLHRAGLGAALAVALLPCAQKDDVPVFGTTVVIPLGLRGNLYRIPVDTKKLPEFEKLKPVGTIYTTQLSVTPRQFTAGFPGVTRRDEWFAIDYRGRFWIEQPGKYRFSLLSDDGSRLYIDDTLVINNDGQHPPWTETGSVQLGGGVHSIRVSYFQGPRTELALVLQVAPPRQEFRIFSTNEFKPPRNVESWKFDDATRLRAQPETLDGEEAALAVLSTTPLPNEFEIRARAMRLRSDSEVWKSALVIELPGKGLVATPDPVRKTNRVHATIFGFVKNGLGETVDRLYQDASFDIPDNALAGVLATPFTYSRSLRLEPGRYTVEAVVMDREGKRASATKSTVEVPAPGGGIALSDLTLVQGMEAQAGSSEPFVYAGNRVVPMLTDALGPEAKPIVYFVVTPNGARTEKASAEVEFVVNGQAVSRNAIELPAPDASGVIPVLLRAGARPGECELRVTVRQGAESDKGVLRYTVAAREKPAGN